MADPRGSPVPGGGVLPNSSRRYRERARIAGRVPAPRINDSCRMALLDASSFFFVASLRWSTGNFAGGRASRNRWSTFILTK